MYQNIKKERGITLIALVITILILVILAGVTIATLKNTNLFDNALKAKEKSDYASAKEAIELKLSAINTEYEMNGNGEAKLEFTAERLDPEKDSDIEYVRAEYKEEASIQGIKSGKNITKIYTKLKKYKYVFEINDNIQIASIDGKKVNEIKISDTNIVNVRDSLMANNSKLIDEYEIIASNIDKTTITIDLKDKSKTINAVGYIICIGNNAVGMSEQLPYTIKDLNRNTEYKEIYTIAVDKEKNTKISANKLNEKTLNFSEVELSFKEVKREGGTITKDSNGVYTITGNAFLESNETINLNNYTMYCEVNNINAYYNGSIKGSQVWEAPLVLSGWNGAYSFVGNGINLWKGEYIDAYGSKLEREKSPKLPAGWHSIYLVNDESGGATYIDDKKVITGYAARPLSGYPLYIGGQPRAPLEEGSAYFGLANGQYRNIKLFSEALTVENVMSIKQQ